MAKDDPLEQAPKYARRTLWLDREGAEEARENFWRSFREAQPELADNKRTWDVAFAAAIAAFEFVMSGRLEPRR